MLKMNTISNNGSCIAESLDGKSLCGWTEKLEGNLRFNEIILTKFDTE